MAERFCLEDNFAFNCGESLLFLANTVRPYRRRIDLSGGINSLRVFLTQNPPSSGKELDFPIRLHNNSIRKPRLHFAIGVFLSVKPKCYLRILKERL